MRRWPVGCQRNNESENSCMFAILKSIVLISPLHWLAWYAFDFQALTEYLRDVLAILRVVTECSVGVFIEKMLKIEG